MSKRTAPMKGKAHPPSPPKKKAKTTKPDKLNSLFQSVADASPSSAVATSKSRSSTASAFDRQRARILATAGDSAQNSISVDSDSENEEDTAATVLLIQERMNALDVSDKDVASASSACPSSATSSPKTYDQSRAKFFFELDPKVVEKWEEKLDARRGHPIGDQPYTREEYLATIAKAIQRSPHPQAATLRSRYNKTCIMINDRITEEDRFLLFTIGSPDAEPNMLAWDQPPTGEWFRSASKHASALDDERIGGYSMVLRRPSKLRPIVYDGSGVSHASSQAHVGLAERARGHLRNIKNSNYKRANFFYACARKYGGKVGIHLAWAVTFPADQLRKTALLFAARLVIKYIVEASRHEWLNVFLDSTPGHWWHDRGFVGAATHSPATEGITEMSVYTKEELRKRRSAHNLQWRHSLPKARQAADQAAHSAAAKVLRHNRTADERERVNDKRAKDRRRSAILSGKTVRPMSKFEDFDAEVARVNNVDVKYTKYAARGPYFGRNYYTPH